MALVGVFAFIQVYSVQSILPQLQRDLHASVVEIGNSVGVTVLAVALIRGFARASAQTVGNFWVDLTRCTLYLLLPACIVFAQ